jgi:glycosyltransferase involved in cell wall biosynthesis
MNTEQSLLQNNGTGRSVKQSPIHVAHFPFSLYVGGVEMWLLRVLNCAHYDRFRFSLGLERLGGPLEEPVRRLGIEIFTVPRALVITLRPSIVLSKLQNIGWPDVIHCHQFDNGPLLRAAAAFGIKHRIVHIHNSEYLPSWRTPYQRLTMHLAWYWARRYATRILACSRVAAEGCLGQKWASDPRVSILYCGIDLRPFVKSLAEGARLVRAQMAIPENSPVIGHVGRFHEQKNHAFILRLVPEVLKVVPDAHFVLVGDGPLRSTIEAQIAAGGLANRVHLLGTRLDVPALMQHLFDVFLFPSKWEGLSIVMLEAQAAGLPVICATTISEEAVIIPEIVQRLDLVAPVEDWVRAIRSALELRHRVDRERCLKTLTDSDFNIENSVRRLESIYEEMMRTP